MNRPAARSVLPGRDVYMDTLRVISLGWVVLFHWIASLPQLHKGVYTDRMVTAALPQLWPLTWLIDVVPLFMFVGGFANARSYASSQERGEPVWRFLERRYRRILVPTFVLLGVCWALGFLASRPGGLFGPSPELLSVRNTAPFGQLWFLGAYLVQITLVPVTLRAHRRYGTMALAVIVVAAAAADALCWALGSTVPLLVNFALVWMVAHQLGYFYADGKFSTIPARTLVMIGLLALVALTALTSLPAYPRDLLERHWQIAGIDAFTFPLVVQSLWIIAVALLARPVLVRALRVGQVSIWMSRTNAVIMMLFLWHTAAFLVAVLALRSVPGVMSGSPTVAWWVVRPLVVVASACVFVAVLGLGAAVRRGGHTLVRSCRRTRVHLGPTELHRRHRSGPPKLRR